ncbi:hypothetical protein YC2023_069221 [Brassica napus]
MAVSQSVGIRNLVGFGLLGEVVGFAHHFLALLGIFLQLRICFLVRGSGVVVSSKAFSLSLDALVYDYLSFGLCSKDLLAFVYGIDIYPLWRHVAYRDSYAFRIGTVVGALLSP